MNTTNELPRFLGCEEYAGFFFRCEKETKTGKYTYNGETPNKGVKLIMLFVDNNSQATNIENAAFVEIQELDTNGALIHVEHGKADKYEKWQRNDFIN